MRRHSAQHLCGLPGKTCSSTYSGRSIPIKTWSRQQTRRASYRSPLHQHFIGKCCISGTTETMRGRHADLEHTAAMGRVADMASAGSNGSFVPHPGQSSQNQRQSPPAIVKQPRQQGVPKRRHLRGVERRAPAVAAETLSTDKQDRSGSHRCNCPLRTQTSGKDTPQRMPALWQIMHTDRPY